jgi:putative transcriptional regulator
MKILKGPVALAAAAALYGTAIAAGQSTSAGDLGVGKLLVSSRGLGDPAFAESVVVLIQYDQHGAVGLMINRRTQAPLSRVLKDVDTAKRGSDLIYIGGPVELDAVLALLRSKQKPDEAASVLGEVYLVSTKPALEKALAASSRSGDLRVYLGYCGWDSGQLENEVRLGGWWIFDPDASVVFDPYPNSLWSRLIARTEQQIVEATPGARTPARWNPFRNAMAR